MENESVLGCRQECSGRLCEARLVKINCPNGIRLTLQWPVKPGSHQNRNGVEGGQKEAIEPLWPNGWEFRNSDIVSRSGRIYNPRRRSGLTGIEEVGELKSERRFEPE
jgi:hypothetical protein